MTDDRRSYFRIDDHALVKYRVIDAESVPEERRTVLLDEVKASNLRAALLGIDVRLQEVIDEIRSDDRAVATAMELLNRKFSLLEGAVALTAVQENPADEQFAAKKVSLSGGGIAIITTVKFDLGVYVALEIVLLPSSDSIRAVGHVVSSREADDEDGDFVTAIEFVEIREVDRDLLVRHVVRKQSEALRAQREEP